MSPAVGAKGASAPGQHGEAPAEPVASAAAQPVPEAAPAPERAPGPPSAAWIAEARAGAAQRRKEWSAEQSRRWRAAQAPQRPQKEERPHCGARTRAGGQCQARAVWLAGAAAPRNGRCRMHGGLSTGARTEGGQRRAREGGERGRRTQQARRMARRQEEQGT